LKSSIKAIFMVSALVISFAFVHPAWAEITAIYGPTEVSGIVVDGREKLTGDPILICPPGEPWNKIAIYDWGPDTYWDTFALGIRSK
jgi:hypothetical protein